MATLGPGPTSGGGAPPAPRYRGFGAGYLPVAVTAVLLGLVPVAIGDSRYLMTLAVHMLVFAAYAVAFNVVFGSTRQLFLCLGALAGVSAYVSVILGNRYAIPLLFTVPLGMGLSTGLGALFSWVAVRRRLDVIFIGIVTLAFSLVFTNLLLGGRELTGGETGLVVEADATGVLRSRIPAYYVFLAVLVGFLALYRWIQRSHLGWAFRALKDDQLAAELAGVDVARYRVLAGAIGSAMLGLTGALFAAHEGFVSPTTFAFSGVDVRVLVMLALGGIGSLLGPVVGAVGLSVVDELLRPLGQLRLTVYGVVLIVLFLGVRDGAVPAAIRLARRWVGRT